MANNSESRSTPHILVFPFPAQGHMIPLLDLSHHLAARGLSITVVVTPGNLPLLDPLLARSPAVQTLVLPLPPHPSLPPGVENVKDILSGVSSPAIAHSLRPLHHPVLSWARSTPLPVTAILSDFFLGWTTYIAEDLAVPRLTFYSSGPLTVSVFDHLWLNSRREDVDPASPVHFPLLPGSPSFPYPHLPSMYRRYRQGVAEWECMREGMIANSSSWGAVFNTFDALEGVYLDHLRKQYGHHRVWAVGPILPAGPAANRGGRSSVPVEEVMTWLDSMPPASVVYVCFGSQFVPTPRQGEALAAGLEQSGVRFVWSVREEKDRRERSVVPEGFEERTAGRGMVIRGWAPQVAVLGHAAVGSFLTHCGWNSVLEGLVAGVALLAWPMEADQFINTRLLVEELGVGVRICEGSDSVPDAAELARVLTESVGGGSCPLVRERAAEMGKRAMEAVGKGGSSMKDADELVSELKKLCLPAK